MKVTGADEPGMAKVLICTVDAVQASEVPRRGLLIGALAAADITRDDVARSLWQHGHTRYCTRCAVHDGDAAHYGVCADCTKIAQDAADEVMRLLTRGTP